MTAPTAAEADVEVTGPAVDGEIPIRIPVVVIENLDTSDGRFLAAGSLSPRALPLPLLAQPESAHGGDDAGAAGVVGRIDTLERIPGPDVISKRTGQPFPEGTFIWVGTGAISETATVGGYDVADLFRRRFLRGISVDLAGMDYEVLGDESGAPLDPEHPRRQIVTHAAEIAAMTLVPIPAFGDCYAELATDTEVLEPVAPKDLPEGLAASVTPSWRSSEMGEMCGLCAAGMAVPAADAAPVEVPVDAVEQLVTVIDDGTGAQRDAAELAAAIVEFIQQQWAAAGDEVVDMPDGEDTMALDEPPAPVDADAPADTHPFELDPATGMCTCGAPEDDPVHLAADEQPEAMADDSEGDPAAPQKCELGDEPAVRSLLFRDGEAYVAVCDAHEKDARDTLEAAGDVVSDVIEIGGDAGNDEPVDDEPIVAAATTPRPPASWFADPKLDGPTALHVGEDGRVFGHLAVFGQCHVSFPNQCITAPRSASGYAYFQVGAVLCDNGAQVPVGHITLDTGHAATNLGSHAAAAHYDNTGTVVADIAAGEDAHGIWVAGALRSNVDDHTAAKLRAAALSGDWRRVGSSLELVAALAVNTPGFPVPRARVASGEPQALVAAGVVPVPQAQPVAPAPATFNPATLADQIAARLDERRKAGEMSEQQAALLAELDESPRRAAALLAELDDTPARFAAALAEIEAGGVGPKG